MKCSKCSTVNPDDSKFCKECATPLPSNVIADFSFTKTLETPVETISRGSLFAGRYEIIEELGRGGMGRVYKVLDTQINEDLALKILKPEIAADESMIERFRNELKIARKISHKNICRTHDINEEDGKPFITMEYVKGDDLKSLIREHKIHTQERAISIAKQVCEGLAAAHELSVVHRDLKPQNIMIDEKGQAKIMDFGIARSVEAGGVTRTGVMIGTPDYISPEQAEGDKVDHRSDIYALGVILFEMVTGTLPFRGDTALSVALKHKSILPQDPRKLNPELSDDLSRLILICMEKDRERRYQTAEALLIDLQNIEEGLPLGTKIRPRRQTLASSLIRKKFFAPALIVILAVIAVSVWQFLPQKEAGHLLSGKRSLAVMYFENRSSDQELDKDITELLTTNLGRFTEIEVIGRHRLFDILRQIGSDGIEEIDKSNATEIANRIDLKMMMIGSIIEIGAKIRITAQITDVQSGAIIGSSQVDGNQTADAMAMVDELTEKVRESLQINPEGYQELKVADVTTGSIAAYRLFRKGREHIIRWEFGAAIKIFEQAIALDPTFASAHLYLAVAYSGYGTQLSNPFNPLTKARKAISDAKKYSEKATDKERRFIDTYETFFNRDYETAYRLAEDIVENYPFEKDATLLLAQIALKARKFGRSIEAFEATLEIDPTFKEAYLYQAHSLSRLNKHQAAISAIKKHMALLPDAWNPYDSACEIYMKAGHFDEAIRVCEEALKLGTGNNYLRFYSYLSYAYLFKGEHKKAFDILHQASRLDSKEWRLPKDFLNLWVTGRLGILLIYEGKYNEALAEGQKKIEVARKSQNKGSEMPTHFDRGKVLAEAGQYGRALEEYKEGEKISFEIYPPEFNPVLIYANYLTGLAMAKKKDYQAVKDAADRITQLISNGNYDEIHEDYYHLLMAEMYVSQGKAEAARDALEPVTVDAEFFSPRYRVLLAASHSLAGEYVKAIEVYSNFMNAVETAAYYMSDEVYYFLERSKIDYYFAKIFEQQGKKDKAVEHYEKFLTLMKKADPGVAEVEDAGERLARLKN